MSRKFKGQNPGPIKVEKVLRGLIKNLESPQKLQEAYLFELWDRLVDPEVKRRAVPERLYGKVLYAVVADPMWAHELAMNQRIKILDLFQKEIGKENLTDIRFHAGNKFK